MAYQLFQLPKQLNVSSNLTLLAGAKAYFYENGTSTPQDTYEDAGLSTPHTNPVEADAAGVFPPIYFDPELEYRCTLRTSADVLIYTQDNVNDQLLSQAAIGGKLYPLTLAEQSEAVTPSNFAYPTNLYDVRRTGAVGNDIADDHDAFEKADSVAGSLFVPRGTYKIGSNLTLSRNIVFEEGAILKPSNAVTITINGWINAGDWQVFDTSVGGVISGSIKNPRLLPEWWGAAGDDSTDDTTPIQECAKACKDAGYKGVQLGAKTYRITDTIDANGNDSLDFDAPSWYGVDYRKSVLNSVGFGSSKPMLKFRGGSGETSGAIIEGIGFKGHTTNSIGIQFAGKNGVRVRSCRFSALNVGVHWYNEDSGSFTEYCTVECSRFESTVATKGYYSKSSGDASMNGCGFKDRCMFVHNLNNVIFIDSGCIVYNAPLDCQLWSEADITLISNSSGNAATFHGQLTWEARASPGKITFGATAGIAFSGSMVGNHENVELGTFVQCMATAFASGGSVTVIGGRSGKSISVTTGANTLALSAALTGYPRLVTAQFRATNYDYRYLLFVAYSGGGAAGVVATLATTHTTNGAGYGAPTLSVDTSGRLVATNAGWPASGVTAHLEEFTISPGGPDHTKFPI